MCLLSHASEACPPYPAMPFVRVTLLPWVREAKICPNGRASEECDGQGDAGAAKQLRNRRKLA